MATTRRPAASAAAPEFDRTQQRATRPLATALLTAVCEVVAGGRLLTGRRRARACVSNDVAEGLSWHIALIQGADQYDPDRGTNQLTGLPMAWDSSSSKAYLQQSPLGNRRVACLGASRPSDRAAVSTESASLVPSRPAAAAVAGAEAQRWRKRVSVAARYGVLIVLLLAAAIAGPLAAHKLAGSRDFSHARICSETCAPSASPPLPLDFSNARLEAPEGASGERSVVQIRDRRTTGRRP
jgi:hypothetical protein